MRFRALPYLAAIAFSAILPPRPARACLRPPEELVVHHAELVKRSEWIALARFDRSERFTAGKGEYSYPAYRTHFTTLEVIKGKPGDTFTHWFSDDERYLPKKTLEGFRDRPGADRDGHRDWSFWESRNTRQWNGADCDMHPRFEVGATYLIFAGKNYDHWRSFERIDRPDDRWLAAVRSLVADPTKPSGLIMSLTSYLSEQEAVFIGKAEKCFQTSGLAFTHEISVKEVLKGRPSNPVFLYGNHKGCRPGKLFLAVIQAGEKPTIDNKKIQPGILIPLVSEDQTPVETLTDIPHIDFDSLGSEAVINVDAKASIKRIREILGLGRQTSPGRR